jgi:cation diffusion facilitator CzcD-associated flavoprotein CzcO
MLAICGTLADSPTFFTMTPMPGNKQTTVLIIGAGPSGLSLGRELRRRHVNFIILEKGQAGESWARMPPSLKLVSPWKCNWLSRADRFRHAPNEQLTREQFLDYLVEIAAAEQLPVQSDCTVSWVKRQDSQFQIGTSHGVHIANILVNATNCTTAIIGAPNRFALSPAPTLLCSWSANAFPPGRRCWN